MQTRRISFWIFWSAVSGATILLASGIPSAAYHSQQSASAVTAIAATAPGTASAPALAAMKAAPGPTSVALAEAMPEAKQTDPKVQVGIASWYGNQEQGRLTASGERFDEHKLTAAHRSLPLDTKVKVTNLENGRSVEVKVNDRGPYIPGRVLDLSTRAAKLLGMEKEGLALVRIEPLPVQTANAALD